MVEGVINVEPDGVGLVVFLEEEDLRKLGHACYWDFVFVGVEEAEGYVFFDQKWSDLLVFLVEGLNDGNGYLACIALYVEGSN